MRLPEGPDKELALAAVTVLEGIGPPPVFAMFKRSTGRGLSDH
jgi:hypothetical protein